jgi:integrase
MASTDYLKLRHRTWYVRVQIPPHLWAAAGGKREYVKTLKTGDLNEASRLKHAYIAVFQRRIRELERRPPDPHENLYEKALAWRPALEGGKERVIITDEEGEPEWTHEDEFHSQIAEEARELRVTHGDEVATRFFKIAKGEGTPLGDELIDTWLIEQGDSITEQTRAQHRTAVTAFITWTGQGALIEDVGRKRAGEFISQRLLGSVSSLSRKTAQRYVSSLSSLWTWLVARGIAADNPWRGQGIAKKSQRGGVRRRLWTDAALIKVLSGSRSQQYTAILHDLVRLALMTGARLDELCALETRNAHKRDDGWWLTIHEGKTAAAVREVPVHDAVAHVLERRTKSSRDGFLFEGLVPGGPDKKRSWNVSKAFGHYTSGLDLGEQRQVFHALRNTFAEALEAAEVPESTAKLLIGHKRSSLTYGHYSKGTRVALRKHINKVRHSEAVMRLLRAPGGPKATSVCYSACNFDPLSWGIGVQN